MEDLYLIVGLGNPGRSYLRTRHNAGFVALEHLATRWRVSWTLEKKFDARLARLERQGRKAFLCLPQTYMNASGEAVAAVAAYHQVSAPQMLVVVDDADLPLGEIRLRPGGSSGGHHGLESIQQHLATRDFPRLRIGIGRDENAGRQITGYVLSRFSPAETELLKKVLDRACDQVECWLSEGILKAMNQFNGRIKTET